ncbi:Asp23/Gls24 family envelope stress response protein [Lentzea sp.]|uniref:Asp23/Gls24 family envelope stress response protein n=1 Tax=Lentzea sp. TaxID=56099 RepID=UPI002ED175DB
MTAETIQAGTVQAGPAERGALTIGEQAVQRLAARATAEVDDVGGAAERVLGISLGSEELDRSAKVEATVHSRGIDLAVRMSLAYPAPVTATTERAREHLCRRVEEMTGMRVRRVDITVTALHTSADSGRRVE